MPLSGLAEFSKHKRCSSSTLVPSVEEADVYTIAGCSRVSRCMSVCL